MFNPNINGNGIDARIKTPIKAQSSKDLSNHRINLSNGHLHTQGTTQTNTSNLSRGGSSGQFATYHANGQQNNNVVSSSVDFMKFEKK